MTHEPAGIDTLMQAAAAALSAGDVGLAAKTLASAVEQQPDNAACLVCYANVLAVAGQSSRALSVVDRALAIDPGQVLALVLRGHLLGSVGRHADALADFESALRVEPDHADALAGRAAARRDGGIALYNLGRYQEALSQLDAALITNHSDVAALIARGLAAGQLDRHQEALQFMERALAIDPGNIDASIERAVSLGLLQRPEEALCCLDEVSAMTPDHVELLNARGASLAQLNRLAEALGCYDRSLALQPDQPYARSDRSLVLLALGDYQQGFREFEVRWEIPPLRQLRLTTQAPLWTGTAELQGRTILLHHEQGFGDTLQFVRYVPRVAALGARVILRVPAALMRLLSTMPGIERLVSEAETLPPHDWHCPLMSLPVAFGDTITMVPAALPYLRADAAEVERWRMRLGPRTRPRIGIAWAGRRDACIADRRDLPLKQLLPLVAASAGVQWISLQKDVPERELADLDELREVAVMPDDLADFADTAALMMNLDLVLSVDTAVVHLAAALGLPVWLMNRHAPCWRWHNGSPWYPAVRQFVQKSPGDWTSVLDEVGGAVEAFGRGRHAP